MSGGWVGDSRPVDMRHWRLSGFCSGRLPVAFDFAGPGADEGRLQDPIYIGRDSSACAFVVPLSETSVSRVHAMLRVVAGVGPCVRDFNSGNGTFVNDRRIEGEEFRRLVVGDTVRLGRFSLCLSHPR
jgi:hypothetical protein